MNHRTIRRGALALALILLPSLAFAQATPAAALLPATALAQQQPDPAQAFAKEWGTVVAADTLAAASHEHVAELAQKLVADYQRQRDELATVKKDAADKAAFWKAWCGDKSGCSAKE